MKIDLSKAYDIINWEFLDKVLIGFGFPVKFKDWIMECVCSTSFSVNCNEAIYGHFAGKKGIRQGDHVSPLLFVMVIEYFSRLMSMVVDLPDFRYHPLCKNLKLNHLCFADDLMISVRVTAIL